MLTFRQTVFTLSSLCASTAVIGNAFYLKGQFYPTVVYITKSNPSMTVIYVQAAVLVWLIAKAMGKLFFGQLREAEFENLLERSWYVVTETCLAFTVFRDDFSPKFVALFVLLLILKGFHWLSEERVDFMERSPNISVLFHVRVLSMLTLLGLADWASLNYACHSVTTNGASVQIIFGFEYAILVASVLYIFVKYVLHSIDSRAETQWEDKAVLFLYTELLMGFAKVILYATFMLVMLKIHTFPLFAIRPMYLSVRALKRAFKDVVLSRRAIHNMNTLYPDATAEELVSADNVCIICREEMTGPGNKKLPCNHIFHATCLRSWFQRQQTCPTCRSDVLSLSRSNRNSPQANNQNNNQNAPADPQAPVNPLNENRNINNPLNIRANFATWPLFNQLPNLNNNIQVPNAEQEPIVVGGQDNAQPPVADGNRPTNPATTMANGNVRAFEASSLPPPPFHVFPPVFVPPPPPIIPSGIDLSSFTDEELRTMENNDRQALELRLQTLRNVQILLDTAVNMMMHYNVSWNVARATEPLISSASGETNIPNNPVSNDSDTAEPSVRSDNSSTAPTEVPAEQSTSATPSSDGELNPNELRRRRLEKLDSAAAQAGSSREPGGSRGESSS